jgi:putative ABC transport system substrate-binding protein
MRRRQFVLALGASAAWPLVAHAQQGERTRRIGVLMNLSENDPSAREFIEAFRRQLGDLGWVDGRNAGVEVRWAMGEADRYRRHAVELAAVGLDVALAATTVAVTALRDAAPTLPIVFVAAIDPVGSGLVRSLARPGGNVTGFAPYEYAIAAKWMELLKEVAPAVTRVAVLRDPRIAAGIGQFAAVQTVAPLGIEMSVLGPQGFEHDIAAFAREPNGGLIVTASGFAANNFQMITSLANRHKLPSVYPFRYYVAAGGLISYGPDLIDPYRRAAHYVARILNGERPADLPVQGPTKYELLVNLRTARALGLDIPPTLLARADEVIE